MKCSKCDCDIDFDIPIRRHGRCDKCWIKCLENSIDYVVGNVIDNGPHVKPDTHTMSKWEWRFAIAEVRLRQLMTMVEIHEWNKSYMPIEEQR